MALDAIGYRRASRQEAQSVGAKSVKRMARGEEEERGSEQKAREAEPERDQMLGACLAVSSRTVGKIFHHKKGWPTSRLKLTG
jgi:hypothetical protein